VKTVKMSPVSRIKVDKSENLRWHKRNKDNVFFYVFCYIFDMTLQKET